jgi:UPF0271 protein
VAAGSVDLNADVGERSDPALVDGTLLDTVTSASVACGAHAGNRAVMAATIAAATARGVVVGAHPSYLDRTGFGRRAVTADRAGLARDLRDQLSTLAEAAGAIGARVRYVKAHGALYNDMADDAELARTVAGAVRAFDPDLVLLVRAGSAAVAAAGAFGLVVATEAFADRAYRPDGGLVARTEPGALHGNPETAARQAELLAREGRVRAVDGTWIRLSFDSLCIHGDTPSASIVAAVMRARLEAAGIAVTPFVARG